MNTEHYIIHENARRTDVYHATSKLQATQWAHANAGVSLETLLVRRKSHTLRILNTAGGNSAGLRRIVVRCTGAISTRYVVGFELAAGLFAATRMVTTDGEDTRKRAGWNVTHIPSGKSATVSSNGRCRTLADAAKHVQNLLATTVDWDCERPHCALAKNEIMSSCNTYCTYTAPEVR